VAVAVGAGDLNGCGPAVFAYAASAANLEACPVRPSSRAASTRTDTVDLTRFGAVLVKQGGHGRGIGGELLVEAADVGDQVLG
jgi:hypothetical protein